MKTIMDMGGPAFPTECPMPSPLIGDESFLSAIHPGMTLRDYFAAKAIIALMQDSRWVNSLDNHAVKNGLKFKDALAFDAYQLADAMLKARES